MARVRTNNSEVFDAIARACTPEIAVELGGLPLTTHRGRAAGRPELKKMYRSPWRTDNTPSLNFFKLSNGIILFNDFGENKAANLISFVARCRGCDYAAAARLIDQKTRLGLWIQPTPKKKEDGTRNIDGLKITLDPDDEVYELIQKQLGLVGDSSWLKEEPMLVVGTYFGIGNRGQKYPIEVWGLIEEERKIGRIRGLLKPFSRSVKSQSIKGWRNGLCGLSELSGDRVFIAEGEKDFLALKATGFWDSGLFATTANMKPREEEIDALRGKQITICAQADKEGFNAAKRWASSLTEEEVEVFIPKIKGADWADVMHGNEYKQLGIFPEAFTRFNVGKLLSLNEDEYPEPKKEEILTYSPCWDRQFTLMVKDACERHKIPFSITSTSLLLEILGLDKTTSNRSKIRRHLGYCVTHLEFLN